MTKERVYDDQVSPLMTQIIAICKANNINMAATFSLDHDDEESPLFCTTVIDCDKTDEAGFARIQQCRRIMYPSQLLAFTIIGAKP